MYCTQCGLELRDGDRFCSRCGARTGVGAAPGPRMPLMLDKRNKKIAGVCAGFARHFSTDVTLMRILWLAFALGTGVGFIVYLAAWIIVPSDRGLEYRVPEASTQPQAG
jgi:phage shock protein C